MLKELETPYKFSRSVAIIWKTNLVLGEKNDCKDDTFWLLLTIINKVMTMEMQMGDGSNKYFIS